jgi:parallel beta-helix repeat protein
MTWITKSKPSVAFTADESGAVPAPGTSPGKFLRDTGIWSAAKTHDAIVSLNGDGDYLLPSAAFAAGHKRVWLRAGVYNESDDVVIPNEGMLDCESGAVIDFGGQAYSVTADSGATNETTGTFAVSGAAVTGTGTLFTNLSPGDFIFIGPDAYPIASITNDATLTLGLAWLGPNRSGLPMFGRALYSGVSIRNLSIRNSSGIGLHLRGNRKLYLTDTHVQSCAHGIHVDSSINIFLRDTTTCGNTNHGIKIATSRSIQLLRIHAYSNAAEGLVIEGGLAHKITDCEFSSNLVGAKVQGNASDCTFAACGLKQNGSNGLETVVGSIRLIALGCTIAFNGGIGLLLKSNDSEISSNAIFNSGSHGIELVSANDVTIAGNRVTGNGGSGIVLPGTGVERTRLLANNSQSYTISPGVGSDTTIFSGEYEGGSVTTPVRHNSGATAPPNSSDDNTKGYQQGSTWTDATGRDVYVCINSATNAALWKQINVDPNSSRDNPGRTSLGSLLDYPASGGSSSGEVQYTRVWMFAQTVLDGLQCFLDTGGNASRDVRFGIYDQVTPTDPAGVPNNLVASTLADDTGGDDGTFKTISLTSNYTVPVTGYYWLAIVQDSTVPKFAVSVNFRANYLPVYREDGSNTDLPATASNLSNPVSALIYVAATEAP